MPTITNIGVIPALVNAYLINGRDKSTALTDIGYKQTYARSTKGMKLFDRGDVIAEVRAQELALIAKTGYTKEQAQLELEQARELAGRLNQPSACVSAVTAKMRLHGMDQPEARKDSTVIVINPPSMQPRPTVAPPAVLEAGLGQEQG